MNIRVKIDIYITIYITIKQYKYNNLYTICIYIYIYKLIKGKKTQN